MTFYLESLNKAMDLRNLTHKEVKGLTDQELKTLNKTLNIITRADIDINTDIQGLTPLELDPFIIPYIRIRNLIKNELLHRENKIRKSILHYLKIRKATRREF